MTHLGKRYENKKLPVTRYLVRVERYLLFTSFQLKSYQILFDIFPLTSFSPSLSKSKVIIAHTFPLTTFQKTSFPSQSMACTELLPPMMARVSVYLPKKPAMITLTPSGASLKKRSVLSWTSYAGIEKGRL